MIYLDLDILFLQKENNITWWFLLLFLFFAAQSHQFSWSFIFLNTLCHFPVDCHKASCPPQALGYSCADNACGSLLFPHSTTRNRQWEKVKETWLQYSEEQTVPLNSVVLSFISPVFFSLYGICIVSFSLSSQNLRKNLAKKWCSKNIFVEGIT
jgi:hypothetical protein